MSKYKISNRILISLVLIFSFCILEIQTNAQDKPVNNDSSIVVNQQKTEAGQNLSVKQPVINYNQPVNLINNKLNHAEKIVFVDTTSKSVLSEYNLKENDPLYAKLGISQETAKSDETNGFMVDSIPIGSLIPQKQRSIYSIQTPDTAPVTGAYIIEKVFDQQENYVVIVNTAALLNDDVTIAGMSTINVNHTNGQPYLTVVDSNLYVEQAAITADGKYLGVIYGAEDQWGILIKYSYRITNTSNGKIIIDEPINSQFRHFWISTVDSLICLGLEAVKEGVTFLIFDFDKNVQYFREFPWNQYKQTKKNRFRWLYNSESVK